MKVLLAACDVYRPAAISIILSILSARYADKGDGWKLRNGLWLQSALSGLDRKSVV